MKAVTADTNIYISGLHFGGVPMQFLECALSGAFRLAASEPLLDEVRRVRAVKFGWSSEAVSDAFAQLGGCTDLVRPAQSLSVVTADPDDDRILECAVEAASGYLVTGDRHLLQIGRFRGIEILRVTDFMDVFAR